MMRKISDVLKEKERTYSFEFFLPRTPKGRNDLYGTVDVLKDLKPDFLSVTYRADQANRGLTTEIVDEFQESFGIPTMHHLTCVGHTEAELNAIIDKMREKNICNILALRGDPPQGVEHWEPTPGGLEYCYQLIELIRSRDDFFTIGVAGFPEGHIDSPDKETDSRYLKTKIDAGAEFVITQLFFDNRDYFGYVERLKRIGVSVRIIPGILPVTDYRKLLRFCQSLGSNIPQRVHDIFKPLDGDAEATYKAGVQFAVEQCNELLEGGAPGLHFYTLNKADLVQRVFEEIKR